MNNIQILVTVYRFLPILTNTDCIIIFARCRDRPIHLQPLLIDANSYQSQFLEIESRTCTHTDFSENTDSLIRIPIIPIISLSLFNKCTWIGYQIEVHLTFNHGKYEYKPMKSICMYHRLKISVLENNILA